MRSIDAPWQAQSTRDATEEERQLFKEWLGDLLPGLCATSFRLKIQDDPVNCTVKKEVVFIKDDHLYVLCEKDVPIIRKDVARRRLR